MKARNQISLYQTARKFLSVGLMVFALGFLTISNAFIYPDDEGLIKISSNGDDSDSTGFPLPLEEESETTAGNANNMAEERAESGNGSLSEYLHDHNELHHPVNDDFLSHNKCNHIGECLSIAFELNTPPPERA